MVKRYYAEATINHEVEMEESPYGDWVDFADYHSLENELCDLRNKYDKLVMRIGDLYREA